MPSDGPSRTPTLQEVAAEAGVSLATASNALSGNRGVSAALRERVVEAAQRIGYPRGGSAARSRKTERVTVGIVLPDVRNPAYAELAHAFEREGKRREWSLVLASSDYEPEKELEALERLVQTTDGVVVSPSRPPRSGLHRLTASPVPIVTCDEPADSPLIGASVRTDSFGGGRAAAHHLVDAGGTRFGMLGGAGYLPSTQERREGFLAGLRDRGVPDEAVHVVGDVYGMDGGQSAMYELLELDPTVDAVFAVSDMHAVGGLFEAQQSGRSVPGDLLICGYDGIGWTRQISPTITTIRQDWAAIATRATDYLAAMMNGGEGGRATLPVELVVGESTRR
ncbi:LacI family transcriptional regulator [Herbiconiux moechotypicola]|uniref:LacI family DNA-binding transcriptional regulator n=1 Tax=Herbiconiux moechotypicola TaxID=637393 RepID=A0ABN3DHD4_9MICO|nr:LacI family DNA-binding transcriptional regulator [Herbiconiux moechotypicola]MCS5729631.1 LacI family transcriptional regulator [Herbiconiux moechotypicola]